MLKIISLVSAAMMVAACSGMQSGPVGTKNGIVADMFEGCAASINANAMSPTSMARGGPSVRREWPDHRFDCGDVTEVYLGILNVRNLDGFERGFCTESRPGASEEMDCDTAKAAVRRLRSDTTSRNGESVQLGMRFKSVDPASLVSRMKELCENGIGDACISVAKMVAHEGATADFNHIDDVPDLEQEQAYYQKGCDVENERACYLYRGTWRLNIDQPEPAANEIIAYFEAACDSGHQFRCEDAEFVETKYGEWLNQQARNERYRIEQEEKRAARRAERRAGRD